MKSITTIVAIIFLFSNLYGCTSQKKAAITQYTETGLPDAFPNLIVDEVIFSTIKAEIETSEKARKAFETLIGQQAVQGLTLPPYAVLKLKKTEEIRVNTAKSNDAIYSMAVYWLMADMSDENREQYLNKITELILKWASVNVADWHTPQETHLFPIYEAYSIVRRSISQEDRQQIDNWIRTRAEYFKTMRLHELNTINNWTTIRLNFFFYSALILEDEALYSYSIDFLKKHLDVNIFEGGKSEDLDRRDGFAYHAYNLSFYARILKTIGMFKGKEEALRVYNLKNHIGVSIKDMVTYWEPYLLHPKENPHMEFANSFFEGDKKRGDAMKPYNPVNSIYALELLSYIDDRCARYIDLLNPESGRYNNSFVYWIHTVQK